MGQIIDLQRRIAEVGRIRIGQQVQVGNSNRTRPAKLDTFRLTSADKLRIEQAAQLYGGQVKPWQAPAGKQWEVVTTTDALDVIVPPSDMAFSQAYELWSAGGCQRRCDGRLESLSEGPCLCDPTFRECDIHTRLSVMLRDLPGLGVWRIDTSGYYAAVEMQGAVQVIQIAAGRGQMLPARLRLEQRQVKRMVDDKPQTRKFAVPVLDIDVSPGQLLAGGQVDHRTGEISGEPPEEITRPGLTPVPLQITEGPVESIAEQAAKVADEQARRPRKNAAAPLPETGLAPRTAAQTAEDEDDEPEPHPVTPVDHLGNGDPITEAQLTALHTAFTTLGYSDRAERLEYAERVVQHPLTSSKQLSKSEASLILDALRVEANEAS